MSKEAAVVNAVVYAMRCGLFFPVLEPSAGAPVRAWVQWGAMRHLHDTVAALSRSEATEGLKDAGRGEGRRIRKRRT